MKETLQKLTSLGFNAIAVHIELIQHKNGETWAYTNRRASNKATVFGDSSVNASLSILKVGEPKVQANGNLVTLWLNDCDNEMAQMYMDDFGKDAIIILDKDENGELITYKQANELLIPQDVPASTDAPSQQA